MKQNFGKHSSPRRRVITPVAPQPGTAGPAPGNVFTGANLWVEDNTSPYAGVSDALLQYNRMVTKGLTTKANAMKKIVQSAAPTRYLAEWTGTTGITTHANNWLNRMVTKGALPFMGAYALPKKSAVNGGFATHAEYRTWATNYSLACGAFNIPGALIVEPDGLSTSGLTTQAEIDARAASMAHLISEFKINAPKFGLYLDAVHSNWMTISAKVARLQACGVANARGICTNISNFQTNANEIAANVAIIDGLAAAGIADRRFIIDTSRNGHGPITGNHSCQANGTTCCAYQWNPPPFPVAGYAGACLGDRPGTPPSHAKCDGYMWTKEPGGSDESCGQSPYAAAGTTYPPPGAWVENQNNETGYALDLCLNTPWTV